jgi:PKD repeat protein
MVSRKMMCSILKGLMTSQKSLDRIASRLGSITKESFKIWKPNYLVIYIIVGITVTLLMGIRSEAQASVTYNYVGNPFDANALICKRDCNCDSSTDPEGNFICDKCTCLDGNITISVTFDDVPYRFTGTLENAISITASAPGLTLSCSGEECICSADICYWTTPRQWFNFVDGKIIDWVIGLYSEENNGEICSSHYTPNAIIYDYAIWEVPMSYWWEFDIYKGGNDNSPGVWSIDTNVNDLPPHASFEFSPKKPYIGKSIIFDTSSSYDQDGKIVTYHWDFGDGSTGENATPSHSYTQSGQYIVTLTITDDDGLVDSFSKTLEISPANLPPVAHFLFDPPLNACPNQRIFFDGSFSYDTDGIIINYHWDFGDGNTEDWWEITEHNYSNSGTYTVTLTVKDDSGATNSIQQQIIISDQCGTMITIYPYLAGTWNFKLFVDNKTQNNPVWERGTMVINLFGTVVNGTIRNSSGINDILTGGYLTNNNTGQVFGSLQQGNGVVTNLADGSLEKRKNIIVMVGSSGNFRGIFIAIKEGETFKQNDIAGAWYIQNYLDNNVENAPYWRDGTLIIDPAGNVTGGSVVNDLGVHTTLTGGSLVVDNKGKVSGSLRYADGSMNILPYGKLDKGKNIMSIVVNSSSSERGLIIAERSGGAFKLSDLAGTWYLQLFEDNKTTNTPFYVYGNLILDSNGNITEGTVKNDSGSTRTLTGGSFSIDDIGQVTGTLQVTGGVSIMFKGKMDRNKSILSLTSLDSSNPGISVLIKSGESIDSDYDGITDEWEIQFFGNTSRDGSGDYDNDGLSDLKEYQNYTNPSDSDTDDDNITDSVEVNTYSTNPTLKDTESDGIPDGWEIQYALDPFLNDASIDTDSDGYNNFQEYLKGTNPNDSKSHPSRSMPWLPLLLE